jgi:predicted flap endonuclease-1-like 5' DNA nuclease
VQELDEKLEEFKGRIVRDNWVEQAKQLAEGQA